MSSIAHGIAGSVSQAALQQSQVAKSRDARKNERAERARRMREILEQRLVRVDDSTAIRPADLQEDHPDAHPSPPPPVPRDADDEDTPPMQHVDVTA